MISEHLKEHAILNIYPTLNYENANIGSLNVNKIFATGSVSIYGRLQVGSPLIGNSIRMLNIEGSSSPTMWIGDGISRIEHGVFTGHGGFFWLDNAAGNIGCLMRGYADSPNYVQAYFLEGKIGIGTSGPTEQLEVIGKIKASDSFNISGTDGYTGLALAGSNLLISGGIIIGLSSP